MKENKTNISLYLLFATKIKPTKALVILENFKSSSNRRSSSSPSTINKNSTRANNEGLNEEKDNVNVEKTNDNEQPTFSNTCETHYYQQLIMIVSFINVVYQQSYYIQNTFKKNYFKYKLKCYFMMNSKNLFEKELRQLIDFNLSSNNKIQHQQLNLDTKIKYYKAQECFIANDLPACFKHLILNYVNSLNSFNFNNNFKKPYVIEQLESLISNDFKLNMLTQSNLINSFRNDFFLNLLTTTQSLSEWIEKQPLTAPLKAEVQASVCHVNTCFLFNNLSILNFGLKKYALSCLFAKKSLSESQKFIEKNKESSEKQAANSAASLSGGADKESNDYNNNMESSSRQLISNAALKKMVQNRNTEILYNLGVSLLFNKQPVEAFECLHQVASVYTQNVRVWLRLAESCLMCYRHSLVCDSQKTATSQFIKINSTTSANEKIFKLSEKIKCIGMEL